MIDEGGRGLAGMGSYIYICVMAWEGAPGLHEVGERCG